MPALNRLLTGRLMSLARQEVRVHSRWEIVGRAEKQGQTVGTILTIMYVILYVGGGPSFARELLSDRRMPLPGQATSQPKKQPKRNGEQTKLENHPTEHMTPSETAARKSCNVSRTLDETNGKASYNAARFLESGRWSIPSESVKIPSRLVKDGAFAVRVGLEKLPRERRLSTR
jgi:hypothetical protein